MIQSLAHYGKSFFVAATYSLSASGSVATAAAVEAVLVAVGLTFCFFVFKCRPGKRKDALAVDRYQLRWLFVRVTRMPQRRADYRQNGKMGTKQKMGTDVFF